MNFILVYLVSIAIVCILIFLFLKYICHLEDGALAIGWFGFCCVFSYAAIWGVACLETTNGDLVYEQTYEVDNVQLSLLTDSLIVSVKYPNHDGYKNGMYEYEKSMDANGLYRNNHGLYETKVINMEKLIVNINPNINDLNLIRATHSVDTIIMGMRFTGVYIPKEKFILECKNESIRESIFAKYGDSTGVGKELYTSASGTQGERYTPQTVIRDGLYTPQYSGCI